MNISHLTPYFTNHSLVSALKNRAVRDLGWALLQPTLFTNLPDIPADYMRTVMRIDNNKMLDEKFTVERANLHDLPAILDIYSIRSSL